MKLILDELRVDSSIVQVTEDELTAVKGGGWWGSLVKWFSELGLATSTIDTIQSWISGGASGGDQGKTFEFQTELGPLKISIKYASGASSGNAQVIDTTGTKTFPNN